MTAPRTGTFVRGYRLGPPNGMPLGKPYQYRGGRRDREAAPGSLAAAKLRGAALRQSRSQEYRERLAVYWAARDQGAEPAEAAARAGITVKTALRNYETRRPVPVPAEPAGLLDIAEGIDP